VKYNVFDRKAVFVRRGDIKRRIQLAPNDDAHMPQDRALDANTIKQLTELVDSMQAR
jgi:hypothetical protein